MKKLYLLIVLQLITAPVLYAQSDEEHGKTEEHEKFKRNDLSAAVLLALAPEYNEDGEQLGYKLLPGVGLDYSFKITRRFGLSLATTFTHFDLIVSSNDGEIIERGNVLSITLLGFYEPIENWKILAGYGREFDKEENFGVVSIATDYAIPIRHNWAAIMLLASHFRTHFLSFDFGVGFAKRF